MLPAGYTISYAASACDASACDAASWLDQGRCDLSTNLLDLNQFIMYVRPLYCSAESCLVFLIIKVALTTTSSQKTSSL